MVIVKNEKLDVISINDENSLIVNPVNCVGVSGAGFAALMKNIFTEEQLVYERECKMKRLHLGSFLLSGDVLFIPTKTHWKDNFKSSKYKYTDILQNSVSVSPYSDAFLFYQIYCSFMKFTKYCLDNDKSFTIHMPLIGCGLAGGNADDLIAMFKNEFSFTPNKYIIYDNR